MGVPRAPNPGLTPSLALPHHKSGLPDLRRFRMRNRDKSWLRGAGTVRAFAGDDSGVSGYFPNASTFSPSRLRTIQKSSTVSKLSEIEVAAAAPWPPKRGTSKRHSTTFMAKAAA
jgi:hypothetical protein